MNRKEWLEKLGGVIDAKDSAGFSSYFTEEGTFKFGNTDAVIGKSNVQNYVDAFFKMISKSEHKVVNFWEHDSTVIWQGEVTYTRLDQKIVTVSFCNIFQMKGDLIEKYLIYIDNTPLFQ